MKFINGPDIALAVKNVDEVAKFFQETLGIENKKSGEDYYSIEMNHYNHFPVKSEEFTIVLEFFVDNLNQAKDHCLNAGCRVIRWNERDH